MSGRARLAVPCLALLLVLVACDALLVEPAPGEGRAVFSLGLGAASDPAAAFAAADLAHVTLTGGVALDTLVDFAPAEARLRIVVPLPDAATRVDIVVDLLRGPDALFRAAGTGTLEPGRTTSIDLTPVPVAAALQLPDSLPTFLTFGGTARIDGAVVFATGDDIPDAEIEWTSSDASVATVDAAGVVTAVGDGPARITARHGDLAGSVDVRVRETPASRARVCSTPDARVQTFSTLREGVAALASGGILRLCAGTHQASLVTIDKALTLEPEPGADVTVQGDGSSEGILIRHAEGVVAIRDLTFTGHGFRAIHIDETYADVLIEGSSFVEPVGLDPKSGIFIGASTLASAGVTIRDFTAVGGSTGVGVFGGQVDILDSRFEMQSGSSSLQWQGDASGHIVGNTFDGCGWRGCIRVARGGDVFIGYNTIRTTSRAGEFGSSAPSTLLGIVANGADVQVEGNVVEGVGGVADASNRAAYPMSEGGIYSTTTDFNGPAGSIMLVDNVVRNAGVGVVSLAPQKLIGSDNTIEQVHTGLKLASTPELRLELNDIEGYVTAIETLDSVGAGELICNWWGGASAPTAPPSVSPEAYTPFATAPIANTAVPCPDSTSLARDSAGAPRVDTLPPTQFPRGGPYRTTVRGARMSSVTGALAGHPDLTVEVLGTSPEEAVLLITSTHIPEGQTASAPIPSVPLTLVAGTEEVPAGSFEVITGEPPTVSNLRVTNGVTAVQRGATTVVDVAADFTSNGNTSYFFFACGCASSEFHGTEGGVYDFVGTATFTFTIPAGSTDSFVSILFGQVDSSGQKAEQQIQLPVQ